jgi:hypothetical protein
MSEQSSEQLPEKEAQTTQTTAETVNESVDKTFAEAGKVTDAALEGAAPKTEEAAPAAIEDEMPEQPSKEEAPAPAAVDQAPEPAPKEEAPNENEAPDTAKPVQEKQPTGEDATKSETENAAIGDTSENGAAGAASESSTEPETGKDPSSDTAETGGDTDENLGDLDTDPDVEETDPDTEDLSLKDTLEEGLDDVFSKLKVLGDEAYQKIKTGIENSHFFTHTIAGRWLRGEFIEVEDLFNFHTEVAAEGSQNAEQQELFDTIAAAKAATADKGETPEDNK